MKIRKPPPPPPPPAPTGLTTGELRLCTNCASWLGDASKFSTIIMHESFYKQIPLLKIANPNVKVYAYKNSAFAVQWGTSPVTYPVSGVDFFEANNHPEWFLLDSNGNRIYSYGWGNPSQNFYLWMMDIGNTEYQQAWIHNVVAPVKQLGFDGVYLDDVNEGGNGIVAHLGTRTLQKYSSTEYTTAMHSLIGALAPAIKAQGLLSMPNVALDAYWLDSSRSSWKLFTAACDGVNQEHYTKFGADKEWHYIDSTNNAWDNRQWYLRYNESIGKSFYGIFRAPIDDYRSQRYARASFLIDHNGVTNSSLIYDPGSDTLAYTDVWTKYMGKPLAVRTQPMTGVWKRTFEKGVIYLNTTLASVTVDGIVIPATDAVFK